jgi:hypothetical protein
MMNPELATLVLLLAHHDWTYNYSDDYTAWSRGRNEAMAIRAEKQRLARECLATEEEIDELDEKYRPKNL